MKATQANMGEGGAEELDSHSLLSISYLVLV